MTASHDCAWGHICEDEPLQGQPIPGTSPVQFAPYDLCCYFNTQRKCFTWKDFGPLAANDYTNGPYDGWYLYITPPFTYDAALDSLRDDSGVLQHLLGLEMDYAPTSPLGTDIYR